MIPENSRCVRHHRACSWHHTDQVTSYREERQRQERVREDETGMYPAEMEEWDRTHTMITFKQWLIMAKRH
ncbi:hypothetical protein SEA_APIARY_60 [Rhodococcus phage Apiary]|nr:hypothetical protein SEA_BRAXOADDIE_60 [Rhodococcus phage Braxoaddie]WNM64983.1 hypothetical protein SEA_MASELOP_60 [Rhodococcus phage Maselop]WNM67444.1 hypothetical protein SEA_POLYYUKI_60 [Rhodococcus phage Polyyuki]WNM69868.1 hypothetical protein SEA_APIARY_60 [Rhodococcus phage Apiary]